MNTFLRTALFIIVTVSLIPSSALAYGGPGSVIPGIGAFLAAVAALLASLFGFSWFLMKWLYKRWAEEETPAEPGSLQ